jgi:WD40 repeat protein
VRALAVTPDGKFMYLGDFKGGIEQIEISEARYINRVTRHTSWVNGLAMDKSGELLASAASDNTVRLWQPKTLEEVHAFQVKEGEVRSAAISPGRKLVAAGIRYGGVRVWDLETKKEIVSLIAHSGETWAVAFTPDGKTLASGGGDWNKPGEVRLWDGGTWKERATLKHTGEVLCLAISPDGHWLAAGSWDRTVKVWDLSRVLAK